MSELTDGGEPYDSGRKYDLKSAAREIGISVCQLVSWERKGLFRGESLPNEKRETQTYTLKDIMRATLFKLLMETKLYTFERAKERIDQLE